MKVSRLRLMGFKSFTEPTELVVEAGLTGVVGPNGCGKSNLLEALRWVMGETSHKSMRAASMNDVIFSGTNMRPARNWAEVTLFIDNAERTAPTEFNNDDVIEIARRIERDAGSAYRINGRESRAKDVKILFEDAATGARSPALVRQGQIGDIVNAKPEARRRILEDAAGIAGLHSRRHDAELRLNAAERNITRLDDVLGGLTSQIESLKRQARQARRYKEVSEQIRRVQALAMYLSWKDASDLVENEDKDLRQLLIALAEAVESESQALQKETDSAGLVQPLRDEEAKCAAVYGRLKVESENFEREETAAKARAHELSERADQLERDIGREENIAREAAEIITRLESEIANHHSRLETGSDAVDVAMQDLADAEKRFSEAESSLGELTRRHAVETARRTSLEATLAETEKSVSRLEGQIAGVIAESREVQATAPDESVLSSLEDSLDALSVEINLVDDRTVEAEERVRACEAELQAKRDAATAARLAFNAIKTERETLSKLLNPAADGGAYPAILDAILVTPGYETALGAALGDDLDAPVAADAPVRWTQVFAQTVDPDMPDGVDRLSAYVQGPPELLRRLNQIGVVNREQGARLHRELLPGQRLVTRDGDLWRWDGFVAACEGATPAAQRLAQRNRMSALAHEELDLESKLELCVRDEQDCSAILGAARERENELRLRWRELQSSRATQSDELGNVEREVREYAGKLSSLAEAKTRHERDITSATAKTREIETVLAALNGAASDELSVSLEGAQAAARGLRAEVSQKQAVLSEIKSEHRMRAEQVSAQTTELERWCKRAESAGQHAKTLREREVETHEQLGELSDLPDKLEARRQQLFDSLEVASKSRTAAADRVVEAESTLKDTTRSLRELQGAVSEARERRARVEARLEAARERLGEDARRIRDAVSCEPEECLALAELEDDADPPPLSEVEQRLLRLKADRERLGGVNLQADDELVELETQRDQLGSERTDVEDAIAKLRGGIAQLNREGRRRLREAFETVNGHFERLFSVLFDGGEARLEMIESDEDPLEGGLEIIAKPPGKKPATLSLLSGGEQTLTALSLIFAVFLTNPSPICVLDEVDAPLDDANVDRFCTLMEKMAEETETRFLVITHHPMTMTRMNRLFGVTMAEKGISQLVSVDLETAQGFREAG